MTSRSLASSAHDKHLGRSAGHISDSSIDFSDIPESTDAELATARRVGQSKGVQASVLLREATFESRLSAVREIALALLNEVESLKGVAPPRDNRNLNLQDEVQRFETDLIRVALERTGGNQARAARLLGIKANTLAAKIRRYRISINDKSQGPKLGGDELAA